MKANLINSDRAIKAQITGYTPPPATETSRGTIRIATDEEAQAGISQDTAITPYTLHEVIGSITGNTTYIHEQGLASDIWEINHNLNKWPSITVVDSAENVVMGDEQYIDNNTLVIRFNNSFKGKAYLN